MGMPPHRRTWVTLLSLTVAMSVVLCVSLVIGAPTDVVTWWALAALVFVGLPVSVAGVRSTRKRGEERR